LVGLILGEVDAPVIREIAQWIDLTVSEAPAVRAAARALSPGHRTLAVHFYGLDSVRKLESFDPQKIVREGLEWLAANNFAALREPDQIALLQSISDARATRNERNAGTEFFAYLKEHVIDGFYTSRAGLEELGYRGNGFYASPPGCEHLYA
jgi:hypothetical protein